MTTRRYLSLIAALLLLAPRPAVGQSSTATDATARQKAAREAALADPTLTSIAQEGEPAFALSATEDGGRINGKIGWQSESWDFALVLDAPFDKANPDTSLADLDGLSGNTVGTLSATYQAVGFFSAAGRLSDTCDDFNRAEVVRAGRSRPDWMPIPDGECTAETLRSKGSDWSGRADRAEHDGVHRMCEEHNKANPGRRLLLANPPYGFDAAKGPLAPGYVGYCTPEQFTEGQRRAATGEQLQAVCKQYNTPPDIDLLDERIGECRYLELKKRGPEWEHRALRALPAQSFFTVAYSLSEPSFSFVDPETLEKGTASETNSALGASFLLFRRGVSYGVSYKRRTTFKPGTETQLCRPVGDTGASTCSNVRLGPPTESEQDIVGLDVKWLPRPKLGVDVRLLYDLEEDLFNPHLLLYFLQKGNGGLNGGLDLAHNDEEDFSARVFVGVGFELFREH